MLIGLRKMFKNVASLLYTYTTSGTPGVQGGSYYTTYEGSNGPGIVMSAAYNANSFYSSDLTSYKVSNSRTILSNPIYANGVFLGLSATSRKIISSTNGVDWNETDLEAYVNDLNAGWVNPIYYLKNIFMISSTTGALVYSFDGLNWTIGTGIPGYAKIVYAESIDKFVGVYDGKTYTSNTGAPYYVYFQEGDTVANAYYLAYGNSKIVTFTYEGKSYYSTNGVNWTAGTDLSSTVSGYIQDVMFDGSRFLALSGRGEVASSVDGINWTMIESIPNDTTNINNTFLSLQYVNGKYFAVDSNEYTGVTGHLGAVYVSTNASIWNAFTLDLPETTANQTKVKYSNGKYIFATTQGGIYTSTDGLNWTKAFSVGEKVNFITAGQISTLTEVQTVIGGQGLDGSYVESLLPVKLYEPNVRVTLNKVIATNTSNTTQYFDVYKKRTSDSELILAADDVSVDANSTREISFNVLVGPSETYNSVYVSGTAANVLTFKIY